MFTKLYANGYDNRCLECRRVTESTNPTTHSRGLAAPTLEEFWMVAVPQVFLTRNFRPFMVVQHSTAPFILSHIFLTQLFFLIMPMLSWLFFKNIISSVDDRMPKVSSTHIISNHPSFFDHPLPIKEYLTKEVIAGRMSDPFSQPDVEAILRGPFQIIAVHCCCSTTSSRRTRQNLCLSPSFKGNQNHSFG